MYIGGEDSLVILSFLSILFWNCVWLLDQNKEKSGRVYQVFKMAALSSYLSESHYLQPFFHTHP